MGRREQERLLELFGRLGPAQRRSLLDVASFLVAQGSVSDRGHAHAPAARPAHETVVQAIRRLMRSHPHLERAKLLGETSRCLASHMVDGREAALVIDELEALFARARAKAVAHAARSNAGKRDD